MTGFAPLLEGFLAFALTMLALTTGVSAIVGALHHLRRWHARGLRDMVRLLYSRELLPLLDQPQDLNVDIAGGALIFETTPSPVPHVREKLGDAATPSAAGSASSQAQKASEVSRRAEFIYDMTFMPVPDVVEKLESMGASYWQDKLVSAERLCGWPWYKTVLHPQRAGRRWMTLRYSLAALKADEFRERLGASDVGEQLKKQRAWTRRGLASWDELVAYLWKRFETLGGASSETFARHSRGWSVAVGFLLAFFLNVDSFDLLNSYLTDPALRQQVLARRDAIQAQDVPAPAAGGGTALAPARAELATVTTQLAGTAQSLSKTLDAFASTLGTGDSQRFAASVQAELQSMVVQVKGVQAGVGALDEDLTETEQRIRGVTQSLTSSFPIGWKRFPNCTQDSPDLRCQRQPAAQANAPAPAQANPAEPGQWPILPTVSRWSTILLTARAADPEGFNQWLVGVLLTGLLLGLGTPFWVQAVSAAFNLRRWDPKKDTKADAESGGGATVRTAAPARLPTGAAGGSSAGAPQGT
jgi:hypothetical protein